MHRHATLNGPLAAGLLAVAGAAASAHAGVILPSQPQTDASYRIVAYTGQAAPGGGVWTVLGPPAMSNTGRVAFVGEVQGFFAQTGIWSEGHTGVGDLQPVVREFQTVPSLLPMIYGEFDSSFHSPRMTESGDIAFGAPLEGDGLTENTPTGVFRMVDGQFEPVALPFWPAPGGGLFERISNLPSINNAGQAAFHASLIGDGVAAENDSGLYRADADSLEKVFREGDPIVSLPNAFMGSARFSLPRINDHGVVGVENVHRDNGDPRWAMWRAEPGGMSFSDLIARQGDASPIGPAYSGDVSNDTLSINNAGDAVFVHRIVTDMPNDTGVWLDHNGAESAVAHAGMAGPLGLTFRASLSPLNNVNRDGRVMFMTPFDGPGFPVDSDGIFFRDGAGPVNIVALEGQDAPGMPEGSEFERLRFLSRAINNLGRIAYEARIIGPEITFDSDFGWWVSRHNAGDADLVIFEGQVMSVGGQLRTVDFWRFRNGDGPESGRRSAFNDNNQIGLSVDFTDGSQAVIVATVASLCPGDLNNDGVVDGADLGSLLGAWGGCQDDFCAPDLNADGVIDGADLGSLLGAWGACP